MILRIKVRLFLGILFCCSISALVAQNGNLSKGDSLFAEQKYTEAYEEYERLFSDGRASSAMLLKMAFIQDGLGNYTDALYFLNMYYQLSADRTAIGKIEELADTNNLAGYSYDDTDYFQALLGKYKLYFVALLAAIMVMLTVYIVKKTREEERPMAAGIIQFAVVVCLLVAVNFKGSSEAIVLSDNTLLRSGPSAGAEPIEMLAKGHKVKVLDRNEIWTQIMWDGKEVYVRNGKLRLI